MNGFDIIAGLLLLYSGYRGFRDGIALQLFGLIGLFIGGYLAFRYCDQVGSFLRVNAPFSWGIGFLLILLVVMLANVLLGRVFRRVFHLAGLGALDAVVGSLLGILKMGMLLSLLLLGFESLNDSAHWVKPSSYRNAYLYGPLRGGGKILFPYIDRMKHELDLKNKLELNNKHDLNNQYHV